MKRLDNIRRSLGITQEDLAVLLKVTRSQLSLFEIGKRDLPLSAKEQLAKMLLYMQENNLNQDSTTTLLKAQAVLKKKELEKMVKNNQYKQLLLEKKINIVEKKYKSNLAALQLMKFLEKEALENQMISVIQAKVVKDLKKNSLVVLTKYQIEKEILQAEEKILLKFLSVCTYKQKD